jgi:hypothetical protein
MSFSFCALPALRALLYFVSRKGQSGAAQRFIQQIGAVRRSAGSCRSE